jgi:hypothetical protein
MEKFSTTSYQELSKPEMAFVLVVLGDELE